jgi:hypothetical protein
MQRKAFRARRRASVVAVGVAVIVASVTVAVVRVTAPVPAHGTGTQAVRPKARGTEGDAPKVLSLASPDNLPADCIPDATGPPGAPYELGLVGTVHDGVLNAGPTTVANINATFCGVVTVVTGTPPCGATGSVLSPQNGQVFGSLSVALTLAPGMTPTIGFVAHPGTITGGFSCGSSPGGLDVTLDATVSGTTGAVFGVSCTIGPVSIPLTGVVTGPFTDMTATLSSDDVTVPAVQASPTCPGAVPANIDAIAGLPIAAGGASASLPVTASLYQPAD